ncbi:MAG: amidohydrolase family protein [FCB group bacterium]|nr:amidohydrolase family protein [FCB group bacterium]
MRKILVLCLFMLAAGSYAHDYVPGAAQHQPILLKGGDLYTVSNGLLKNTDLLFENGRITRVGQNLATPEGGEVIDVTGKRVYPGLIAPYSSIGLVEIGAVLATDDRKEIGSINPDVQAQIAYDPDSEIIPSVRANGITTALIVPAGRLVVGRSSLINLDGWTVEDAAEKLNVGLHLNWPQAAVIEAWWMEKSAEEQKKEMVENRKLIYEIFDDAKAYYLARKNDPKIKIDSRWEAMVDVFEGTLPVFIRADDYRQIEQAVAFSKDYSFSMILVGGKDSWMLTDLLKDNNISVVAAWVQGLPPRQDDGYDLAYKLPALLAEAGVKFCLSQGGASWTRNLPFQVGQAIAFGLSPEEGLRSVTLSSAEILGVADDLGSLEVGKKATLIVSDGDIFDMVTQDVVLEFIEGRRVDLDNKHKELYRKYRQKHLGTQ